MAGRGKLIDTWIWRKAGVPNVEIQVRMHKGDYPSYSPKFEACNLKLNIFERGTDLAKMKQEIFAALEDKYAITWTTFYQVSYKGSGSLGRHDGHVESWEEHVEAYRLDSDEPSGEMGGPREFTEYTGCHLKVEEVEEGTYPSGEKCHRDKDSSHIYKGPLQECGQTDSKMDYEDMGAQRAIIPATRENRQALHRLFQAYASLDIKVRVLLAHDNIQSTLVKILAGSGPLALPAPAQPVKPVTKEKNATRRSKRT